MPRKHVFTPHLGREVRVGGCCTEHLNLHHAFKLSHMMHADSWQPPAATSFTTGPAVQTLLQQMFGNDVEGDCVIAARARRIGLLTGNATGTSFIYTLPQVNKEYGRVGGYVVGDPTTDNGCDPVTSANDGVKNGYADGSHDEGWVAVNAADQREVMIGNDVTSGAMDLAMSLPAAWLADKMPQKDGDVWDVAGDPVAENGHDVAVVDHDASRGVLIDTWGLRVWVTWAALAKYGVQSNGGMLIAHVNADAISKATMKAPNGFDWTTLLTYFDSDLGGNLPLPAPPPTPSPSGGMMLAQAQQLARDGINAGPVLMTRHTAGRWSDYGLAKGWPKS